MIWDYPQYIQFLIIQFAVGKYGKQLLQTPNLGNQFAGVFWGVTGSLPSGKRERTNNRLPKPRILGGSPQGPLKIGERNLGYPAW